MFRSILPTVLRLTSRSTQCKQCPAAYMNIRNCSTYKVGQIQPILSTQIRQTGIFTQPLAVQCQKLLFAEKSFGLNITPVRTVTKFSLNKGKRKSVKAVIKRFKRLHWGGWIRTRCGRHKKMFKKSAALKRRLRQHVFVNGTQSWLLDKMVTKFWKRPKYYINDPYEPYHTREEYTTTRSKPIKY